MEKRGIDLRILSEDLVDDAGSGQVKGRVCVLTATVVRSCDHPIKPQKRGAMHTGEE